MATGSGSRLDKLLGLIEGGASPATRKIAASQVADIAKAHPRQLHALLTKLQPILRCKSWEARVAAGECLGLLAAHVQHPSLAQLRQAAGLPDTTPQDSKGEDHKPRGLAESKRVKLEPGAGEPEQATLGHGQETLGPGQATEGKGEAGAGLLDQLDIAHILRQGTVLLASGGEEFDVGDEGLSKAERLAKQRQNLKKRLGLGKAMESLIDTSDLVKDEDLLGQGDNNAPAAPAPPPEFLKDPAQLVEEMTGLSARERNQLKRKLRREFSKASTEGTSAKKFKAAVEKAAPEVDPETAAMADADFWQEVDNGRWPFQDLCDQLCVHVLAPRWEVRHGAAVALREVLRSHAGSAAVDAPVSADPSGWAVPGGAGPMRLDHVTPDDVAKAESANLEWLEAAAVHLLCVLALDRFADYVSDQVAAPTRETAAQALAAALFVVPQSRLVPAMSCLGHLVGCGDWEGRHAGLLGIKYLLAARPDAAPLLLGPALSAGLAGLQDTDDDVRAVAAEALLPVAGLLAELEHDSLVQQLRARLWDILLDVDDLSPSTGSVMQLLAQLHVPSALPNLAPSLTKLVPRLWPFFRHALTSVRLAAVRCLAALLSPPGTGPPASQGWLTPVTAATALTLLFQNIMMEGDAAVLSATCTTWEAVLHSTPPETLAAALAVPPTALAAALLGGPSSGGAAPPCTPGSPGDWSLVQQWLSLACTPEGQALPEALLLSVPPPVRSEDGGGLGSPNIRRPAVLPRAPGNRASTPIVGAMEDGSSVARMRLAAASSLASLAATWPSGTANPMLGAVQSRLSSPSATDRLLVALLLRRWAELLGTGTAGPPTGDLYGSAEPRENGTPSNAGGPGTVGGPCEPLAGASEQLWEALALPEVSTNPDGTVVPYTEMAGLYRSLHGAAAALLNQCAASGWDLQVLLQGVPVQQYASMLTAESAGALAASVPADPAVWPYLARAKDNLVHVAETTRAMELSLQCSSCGALAAAAVQVGRLPPKMNVVVQPLMAAVRRETDPLLRQMVATALSRLMLLCLNRQPSPADRLVKNLCAMACGDRAETPDAAQPDPAAPQEGALANGAHAGPAGSPAQDPQAVAASIARLGAEEALSAITHCFGPRLLEELPSLWDAASRAVLLDPDQATSAGELDESSSGTGLASRQQEIIDTLQVLKVVGPALHSSVQPALVGLMPALTGRWLPHARSLIRHSAASCLTALCNAFPQLLLPIVLREALPLLQAGRSAAAKAGAVELLAQLLKAVSLPLLPFLALLALPLMGTLSDPSEFLRSRAAAAFAEVVALLPLSQGLPPPEGLEPAQLEAWRQDSRFLNQLLDNSKVEEFSIPVEIRGELREYQKAGISWLAFLRRCGLHGVLADDMGLGKTLQATAIVAAAHVEARQEDGVLRPSLIVCPTTLVQHWPFEITKFVGAEVLRAIAYVGNPAERQALQGTVGPDDVVVTSYESLRADADWFAQRDWLYCVLDEGHVIRNPKTKISQAAKRVRAAHRLILSGTPIQNNVLELWALFDFLMPGFLGGHAAFHARYGKALATARASKLGSPEAQAALLAMEGLHKQVLPFILRRNKEAVLKELPPKILQDILVEASPLQARLMHDFGASPAGSLVASEVRSAASGQAPHVFQALQYMRKLCSHPLLVLQEHVAAHRAAVASATSMSEWSKGLQAVHQLHHAPKLQALRELLQECGIGVKAEEGEDAVEEGGGHRVLVFAQLKGMLDLVANDLLVPMGIPFLRLDGSVEASQRFGVVQQFNSDPTIPVMLLTTHVGGLGLNLTAADTVVFLEHDWNPQNDLQAMDRAHRLGQKRTVNVYRILVRGTLEERIMSLQRFKLDVAAAVINQENVSLKGMDTSQLLDLFALKKDGTQPSSKGGDDVEAAAAAVEGPGTGKGGLKAVLEGLEELWDQNQYAEEFSLDAFVSKLS